MIALENLEFQLPDAAPFKNEAAFTGWFGKQINNNLWFFHKISDFSLWFKPFDSIFAYKWLVGCIEFKYTKQASCSPFAMLSWSSPKKPWTQVKSLQDYAINGWNSIVIVYSAKKHNYKILDFSQMSLSTKIIF